MHKNLTTLSTVWKKSNSPNLNLKQKILIFFQYIYLHIYIYIIKKTKRTQKESSPFRKEEKNQSFLFLTTKKAEYVISTTNKRKKNNLGYDSKLYKTKVRSQDRKTGVFLSFES
jgi:hypothetical protein